jgi:perosamine synthetase
LTVDPAEYGRTRDELMLALAEAGIETRPFFVPLHLLPPFREEAQTHRQHHPIAERLGEAGMNLPTHTWMTAAHVERVVGVIREECRA